MRGKGVREGEGTCWIREEEAEEGEIVMRMFMAQSMEAVAKLEG